MQVGAGVVLATNAAQDCYFLVQSGGGVEKIDLARAASLWAEGERKGWVKLGIRETKKPADSAESILAMDTRTWREELQRKLGGKVDE